MRSFPLAVIAATLALAVPACGDDASTPAGSGGSGATGGSGGGGGSGPSGPCMPTAAECFGPQGPNGPGAECLAKKDNTGETVWQGRFSQILVDAPPALANAFVQSSIIDNGVFLNQIECNASGEGTFTWLFELDSAAGTLKTGGGLPVTDPSQPSCFVSMPNAQIPVAPITLDSTQFAVTGNQFEATGFDIVVPIFLAIDQLDTPILLPLHGGRVQATFSADHNCIGIYNGPTLDPINNCLPDTTLDPPQTAWTPGGELSGYITIEEADTVFIDDLGHSLCVQLAGIGQWKGPDGYCKSHANWVAGQRPEGDWCAGAQGEPGTAASASCMDAYALRARFAASAFPIDGDCQL